MRTLTLLWLFSTCSSLVLGMGNPFLTRQRPIVVINEPPEDISFGLEEIPVTTGRCDYENAGKNLDKPHDG